MVRPQIFTVGKIDARGVVIATDQGAFDLSVRKVLLIKVDEVLEDLGVDDLVVLVVALDRVDISRHRI
ncbi:hypothetical protein FQZ97_892740 [compost metagenome]